MDKLIVEYVMTAIEVILACILLSGLITVYNTCNQAAMSYQNSISIRQQQELYAEYAKYDEKTISDTEVLSLLAKGANLPDGIKLYESKGTSSAFETMDCNETVNIGNANILAELRRNIPAGTKWFSRLFTDAGNGEISYIEIRKIED